MVRTSIPQFYVVNYARRGTEIRTGWLGHPVPGAGMAYFGFSNRGLADKFAATADLDHPKAAIVGAGKWLPTFVAYPELRARLEAGLGQRPSPVTLLTIDLGGFNDRVVNAARTESVIQAIAANPEAESGIEVDFEPYCNLAKAPPKHGLRLMDVGDATLLPVQSPRAAVRTAWALRRTDEQIAAIRRHPNCQIVQRAVQCEVALPPNAVQVRLLAMAVALGFEPFAAESISVVFINDHVPDWRGLLENLATQDRTPIFVVGDSEAADFRAEAEQTLRTFAQDTLDLPPSPCTRADFARGVEVFKRQYPTPLAVWERLGAGDTP